MPRTMYDGINTDAAIIAKVIKPGDLVAYYIDGWYKWTTQEIAMFPHAVHVTITVLGNPADVADAETGDLTPQAAANWVVRRKAAGYERPTVYRSLGVMQDIRNDTGKLVMGKDWDSWVADYDGSPANVYPGCAAKQYRNTPGFDVSEVYDDAWPHRKTAASYLTIPPSLLTPRWPAGLVLQFGNRGNPVEALQRSFRNSGIYGVRGITVDGDFGPQTQTAVRNFEESTRLTVDSGIAGNQVRSRLITRSLMNSAGQAID